MDPNWFTVGLAALGLLQIAALAQQRNAREDRKDIVKALDRLADKVGAQNGRVGKLEAFREGHEKWTVERNGQIDETIRHLADRLERRDSWSGPERRRRPRDD